MWRRGPSSAAQQRLKGLCCCVCWGACRNWPRLLVRVVPLTCTRDHLVFGWWSCVARSDLISNIEWQHQGKHTNEHTHSNAHKHTSPYTRSTKRKGKRKNGTQSKATKRSCRRSLGLGVNLSLTNNVIGSKRSEPGLWTKGTCVQIYSPERLSGHNAFPQRARDRVCFDRLRSSVDIFAIARTLRVVASL